MGMCVSGKYVSTGGTFCSHLCKPHHLAETENYRQNLQLKWQQLLKNISHKVWHCSIIPHNYSTFEHTMHEKHQSLYGNKLTYIDILSTVHIIIMHHTHTQHTHTHTHTTHNIHTPHTHTHTPNPYHTTHITHTHTPGEGSEWPACMRNTCTDYAWSVFTVKFQILVGNTCLENMLLQLGDTYVTTSYCLTVCVPYILQMAWNSVLNCTWTKLLNSYPPPGYGKLCQVTIMWHVLLVNGQPQHDCQ